MPPLHHLPNQTYERSTEAGPVDLTRVTETFTGCIMQDREMAADQNSTHHLPKFQSVRHSYV